MDQERRRGIGYECFQCKAYAGPPDPGTVEHDICDECTELEVDEEDD